MSYVYDPKSNSRLTDRLEGERGRYLYLFAALKEKEKGPVFAPTRERLTGRSVYIERATHSLLRRVLTTSWIKIVGYKSLSRDSIKRNQLLYGYVLNEPQQTAEMWSTPVVPHKTFQAVTSCPGSDGRICARKKVSTG